MENRIDLFLLGLLSGAVILLLLSIAVCCDAQTVHQKKMVDFGIGQFITDEYGTSNFEYINHKKTKGECNESN